MIEINAAPDRRDMNEIHARAAAEAGVLILIDSDAHGARTSTCCSTAIATARRAWLTADQVANTRSWEDFAPLRKRAQAERSGARDGGGDRAAPRCERDSPAARDGRRRAVERAVDRERRARRAARRAVVDRGAPETARARAARSA